MRLVARGSLVLLAIALTLAGCDALTTSQHRLARARAELDSGQLGRAAIDLRKLVQSDTHNVAAWLLLARLSLDVGDAGAAQSDLDHAVAAGARGPEFDTLRARTWLAAGQPQALVDSLMHHDLAGIAEPDRSIELARAYNALRQPARAQALLTPLLESHPDLVGARLVLADALALAGRSVEALAQNDRALSADPRSELAYSQRARLLEQRGQVAGAEHAFRQALQNMSAGTPRRDEIVALVGLTETRLSQGEIQLAAQSQAVLAKLAPGTASTDLLAARLKLVRGDSLGGIADLQTLVARAPSFLQAQMLLGTAELQQGNLGQAEQAFQQVVQQAPDDVQAREALASVQLKLNQPEAALRMLTPALSERLADQQLLSLLGAAETNAGTPDSILHDLEHDVKLHPEDRTLRLNLAEAYLSAGRAQQALPLIEGTPEVQGDMRRDGLFIVAVSILQGSTAASAQVEKLVTVHPHDLGVLNLAATYYALQGELARAHGLLQQALDLDSHNVSTFVALAQVNSASGDLPAAETSMRSALALDPSNVTVRIALADLMIARKEFADADKVLAPIASPQAGPQVQFEVARLALARSDLKQADTALDHAVAQQPKSAELNSRAGDVLWQAKQYQAALARYTKATQLSPDKAMYWLNSGRAQLALERQSAAHDAFQRAAQLQPQWLAPVSELVLIDLQTKDYTDARNRVNQVLARRPDDVDALALQGDVEWAAGQFKDAQATYAQAAQKRPSASLAAKLFRTRLAVHETNPEQPLVQWLTMKPNDRNIRTVLGSYYLSEHALNQAAGEFQAILEQVPSDVVALNDLAWIYGELHDPRAEALAERAYQLAPTLPSVDDTLGWILARQGKGDRALSLLQQAAKLDAGDPNVQYHYAYALVQEGQRAEAQRILTNLLGAKRDFDSRHDAERLLADTKT